MFNIHKSEREVKEILKIKIESGDPDKVKKEKMKDRKAKIDLLRLKGNHQHNNEVVKRGKGIVMIGRRRKEETFDIKKYGPCPACLEWLRLTVMARHQFACPASNKRLSKGELLVQSDIISGRLTTNPSQSVLNQVFPIMKQDDLSKTAKQDSLIIALANNWMIRNVGNKVMRRYYTSCIIRLLAQLLIILKKMVTPADGEDLDSYLAPEYFEHVAKAALMCANQNEEDEEVIGSPSNAIKLQYDLKRLTSIKLANAIINKDPKKKKEAEEFQQLMTISWSTKLVRVALQKKSYNNKKPLPLPEDIKQLASHINSEIREFDTGDTFYENYWLGVILVESKLISFNRRRCGEVQAFT